MTRADENGGAECRDRDQKIQLLRVTPFVVFEVPIAEEHNRDAGGENQSDVEERGRIDAEEWSDIAWSERRGNKQGPESSAKADYGQECRQQMIAAYGDDEHHRDRCSRNQQQRQKR